MRSPLGQWQMPGAISTKTSRFVTHIWHDLSDYHSGWTSDILPPKLEDVYIGMHHIKIYKAAGRHLTSSQAMETYQVIWAPFSPLWQDFRECFDPRAVGRNRVPMRAAFFAYENEELSLARQRSASKRFLGLNGTWKFARLGHMTPKRPKKPGGDHMQTKYLKAR